MRFHGLLVMWATVLDFGIFKSSPEGTLSHSPGRSEAEAWDKQQNV